MCNCRNKKRQQTGQQSNSDIPSIQTGTVQKLLNDLALAEKTQTSFQKKVTPGQQKVVAGRWRKF